MWIFILEKMLYNMKIDLGLVPKPVDRTKINKSVKLTKDATNVFNRAGKDEFALKEALKLAHEKADIAIVSSANLGAVLDEWEKHSLLEHTDIVLTQNVGSKAFCISELLKKGYEKENVLMCGDAPGDLKAAETNGVFYYPILVKKEKESWQNFINQGFSYLLDGSYEEYEIIKKRDFYKNLGAE